MGCSYRDICRGATRRYACACRFDDPTNGIGDIVFTAFLSPANPGKWIWGAGPVVQIPTNSDEYLGIIHALVPLSESWSLMDYFDVGAGGSNFTFQGIAVINYQVSQHFVIKGGYRYITIDAGDNNFVYDVQLGGPYLGLGIRF